MFAKIQLEIDDKSYRKQLDLLGKSANRTSKRMMAALLARMKKEARKNLQGPVLEKKSGKLIKSLSYTVRNNFTGWIRASAPYASLQELGAVIKPKAGKLLWLKIQGKAIPAESVTIPARPFLKPVVDEYSKSDWVEAIMDPILQKALDEIFIKETE